MLKRQLIGISFSLLAVLIILSPIAAQTGEVQLEISGMNTEAFPEISFTLLILGSDNRVIMDISDLAILEDSITVDDHAAEPLDVGTELVIVIDADTAFEQRDEAGGLSRREKVRDSLIRYANLFMDPMQLDSVTIIVPEGESGRILDKAGMTFPNEVINAINFYEPVELGEPALNDLMQMALEQMALSRDEGRFQAILLITDAGSLDEQLDFDSLVENAQAGGVALYGAILGSRADEDEIMNLSRLTDPSGGDLAHMREPVHADELYEAIQQRANRIKVSYRSSLDTSGPHTVSAELSGSRAESNFELLVEPPSVQMAVDNSRPIRRVATEPDMPYEQMEPNRQPLVAQVSWPDEQPRILESATLLVNGTEMPVENTIFGDDGLLTFDWDIRFFDEGTYELQILVIDELGLEGISDPLPLTIEIERPLIPPTLPPPTESPLLPTALPRSQPEAIPRSLLLMGAAGLILFLVLFVFGLGTLFLLRGNRDAKNASIQPVSSSPLPHSGQSSYSDPGATYVMPPEFASDHTVGAFLETLENALDQSKLIPIAANNVALGRDAKRAEIVFEDRSVSRLHARIMESRGVYRVYDEGSASGTYVNYERIGLSPRTLKDKDHLHLGRVHLRFHLASSLQASQDPEADTQIFEG